MFLLRLCIPSLSYSIKTFYTLVADTTTGSPVRYVKLPPKSSFEESSYTIKKWVLEYNDVIVPEEILEKYGVIQFVGNSYRVLDDDRIKRMLRLYVIANYGSRRHPTFAVDAVFDVEGKKVRDCPKNFELYERLREFSSLWANAINVAVYVRTAVPDPHVEKVGSKRFTITMSSILVKFEDRGKYKVVYINAKNMDVIKQGIEAIIAKYGFSKGIYGGYILRGELSEGNVDAMFNEVVEFLKSMKSVIEEEVNKARYSKYLAKKSEIEEIRKKLGFSKLADQPITREDFFKWLGVKDLLYQSNEVAPATQNAQEERKAIAIKGFLVISKLPSKSLLDAHLPEIFKDVKIGKKNIKLVMGYFYNKLGSLRRKFYTYILPDYAIDAGFGYIIPRDKVPKFLREVDALKREYEVFEKQLKEFLLKGEIPPEILENKRAKIYKEYLDIVMEYLKKHGAEEDVRRKIESLSIAGRVRINLLPFSIDHSIIEEYVDERVRARVREEVERLTREAVEAARKRIEARVSAILEKLEKYGRQKLTESTIKLLKSEISDIRKEAAEFGIDVGVLDVLEEALEKPKELAKKVAEVKASSERVKALLKVM